MGNSPKIRIEFHSHTIFSKDSLTSPEKLLETCRKKGIHRIVITDHNTIAGAIRAHELDPKMAIIGEEIMTTRGEILAAFVKEEIPPGLQPQEVINRLREQDAFISVSHPFDRWRSGHWLKDDLIEITPLIDAIEIFNARCMLPVFNKEAAEYARQYNLAGTVGSDAHSAMEIGKATLIVPEFEDSSGLKQAIQHAAYQTSLSAPWIHFTSRYAVWRKKFLKGR
jgi:predicted metal-dependent phosphoesterase TrpH